MKKNFKEYYEQLNEGDLNETKSYDDIKHEHIRNYAKDVVNSSDDRFYAQAFSSEFSLKIKSDYSWSGVTIDKHGALGWYRGNSTNSNVTGNKTKESILSDLKILLTLSKKKKVKENLHKTDIEEYVTDCIKWVKKNVIDGKKLVKEKNKQGKNFVKVWKKADLELDKVYDFLGENKREIDDLLNMAVHDVGSLRSSIISLQNSLIRFKNELLKQVIH